ncbi:MAG: long-chain fatty acid--CoA ligase [Solirubrobacterales bacterium]
MEVQTAATASSASTGSTTLADLLTIAATKHASLVAQRHKVADKWVEVSYAELGQIVKEFSLGLMDLGIESGHKVGILSNTRPEWTYSDFAILCAGATVVPIYQTNSPQECEYVLHHSESKAVVVEDDAQLEKVRQVRDQLPNLEHIIAIEPIAADDVVTIDSVRKRGATRPEADLDKRVAAVTPDDVATYIYTSGTTGPPKGCIIDHRNWRSMLDMAEREDVLVANEVVFLFLPLAHAFARLIQLIAIDVGSTIAYWERDPKKIVPNLMEVKATYFPSVPRIFEKIYTLATSNAPDKQQLEQAVELGVKVRQMQTRGEDIPADLLAAFNKADEALFVNVRNLFGGNMKQCVTGAAPIAPEILRFFYACGVPVMEGYGMTETSTAATINTLDNFRIGSVGRAMEGCEIKIADDGEVLIKGPNIFRGYYKNEDATKETIVNDWLHTGDLGRLDEDGFLYITGRKKDIIITAGGKNITPANWENTMKQNRWVSQAVMYGDRQPYLTALVTLDPEEIVPWATEQGIDDTNLPSLCLNEKVRALIQGVIDDVNQRYAQVEQVKKFTILDHDLSQETGELTPTMKVKRNVCYEKYDGTLNAMYT